MQRRLAYIDGLRAIAVLSVALFHARVHVLGLNLETWAKECSHGVDLFFVVSGFCLAYPTLEKIRSDGRAHFDTIAYALKRFLRIVPPYVVVLTIMASIAALAVARGAALPEGMNALAPYDLLTSLLFFDQHHAFVNASFWTLAVEFRWYFIFPLALALAARSMRALLAVTVLIAIAGELTRAGSVDVQVLSAFLLGIVAAWIHVHGHPVTRYALPLGALAVAFAFVDEQSPHFPIQANLGWHVVAFFIVIAAGAWPWLRAALSWKPLAAIGVASYSIYLVHEPIVSALAVGLRPRFGDAAAAAAGIGAGVIAGAALWFVVERPLTQRATVARFVERCRPRTSELFALAGFPANVELGTGRSASGLSHLSAERQEFTAAPLNLGVHESLVPRDRR